MQQLTVNEVMDFLPHREPFLFIDKIFDIIPAAGAVLGEKIVLVGGKIVASFFVKEDMIILQGHFPGNPILPGVVQVEMMAQASCFGLKELLGSGQRLEVALLKIEEAKFRRPIRPGMDLIIESICTKERGNMVQYRSCIKYQNQLMSEASIWATYNIVS